MKNQPVHKRLGYAFEGIATVWRNEHSFRVECWFALAAIAILIVLRPGWVWAAVVALAIALVMALELLNSALEYVIDCLHPAIAPEMKMAKDAAAGAVLLASLGALAVGVMMLVANVKL